MMKRIFVLCTLLILTLVLESNGQAPGPFYRQFYFNPYLFNPAFVAIDNSLEVNAVHRQQWTNFKDAPVTSGLSVQFPTNKRVALGLNIHSDKQVLLRNSNIMTTFGYIVPIAKNQSLRFALSGGVGINKLDLTAEELNTNDPAILRASGNNFYVDGNFGVVYTHSGLRIGFALTDLFKSNAFNGENMNKFEFSNLRNRLFSVSYNFKLDPMGNVSLEPYFLYRQTEDGIQDYWEAATLVYFKENIWTGISYNQNNGLALFFGANVKDKFKFGYSYEFPPFTSGFPSASSHELHVGIKLGKKKQNVTVKAAQETVPELANESDEISDYDVAEPSDSHDLSTDRPKQGGNKYPGRYVEESNTDHTNPETAATSERSKSNAVKQEGAKKTAPKTSAPREAFTMTKGHYYVVVGVFNSMSHSIKYTKEMMDKGHVVNVALNPKNNLYYVYLQSTKDQAEAARVRNDYKLKNLFKEAWVFKME
jgi:type IX secretion system PorP/SprF family membrane protein